MARKTNAALAFALSAALALGTIPAPALAEMAEEAMGAEPVASTQTAPAAQPVTQPANDSAPTTQPAADPAPSPAPAQETTPTQDVAPAESQVGETSAILETQSDPANIAQGTIGTCDWVIDANGNLRIGPTNGQSGSFGTYWWPWEDYRESIVSVSFAPGTSATLLTLAFENCTNLKSVDLTNLDTSECEEMYSTFRNCTALETIDLTKLNTSSCVTMSFLLANCESLTYADISKFDLTNCRLIDGLLQDCHNLRQVNLTGLDTSNVTNMSGLFCRCPSLESVDVSGLNTSKNTSMYCMFNGCSSLTQISVSNFDTTNVTDMCNMFNGCSKLESVDISNFNTEKVTRFSLMFEGCGSLKSVNMSNLTFSSGAEYGAMFNKCPALETVNLSGTTLPNDSYASSLFKYCSGLNTVIVNKDTKNFDAVFPDGTVNIAVVDSAPADPTKQDISGAEISGISGWTYDGTTHTVTPTVTLNGTPLTPGTDYTVTGDQASRAGTHRLVVVGTGAYTGSASTTYEVERRAATVTACSETKNQGDPDPYFGVTFMGVLDGDSVGFNVSCDHGEEPGQYPINVTGERYQVNYEVSFVPGTLTIVATSPTPPDDFHGTILEELRHDAQTARAAYEQKLQELGGVDLEQARQELEQAQQACDAAEARLQTAQRESDEAAAALNSANATATVANNAKMQAQADKNQATQNKAAAQTALETAQANQATVDADAQTYAAIAAARDTVNQKSAAKATADSEASVAAAALRQAQAAKTAADEQVTAKQNAVDQAWVALENAGSTTWNLSKYNTARGSLGFFEWANHQTEMTRDRSYDWGGTDTHKYTFNSTDAAIAELTGNSFSVEHDLWEDGTHQSEYPKTETYQPASIKVDDTGKTFLSYTNMGADGDATSLENMKYSIEIARMCNEYRQLHNQTYNLTRHGQTATNEAGDTVYYLEPIQLNDRLTAFMQININWSTNNIAHASMHGGSIVPDGINGWEILAWGRLDPFEGWYTQEREYWLQNWQDPRKDPNSTSYDAKFAATYRNSTGHYFATIANQGDGVRMAGVGWNTNSNLYRYAAGMNFSNDDMSVSAMSRMFSEYFTVDEYRERFMTYYNAVKAAESGQATSPEQIAYDNAVAALQQAQQAQQQAATALADATTAKQQKDAAQQQAADELAQAQAALQNLLDSSNVSDLDPATVAQELQAAQTAYNQAVAAETTAQGALDDATTAAAAAATALQAAQEMANQKAAALAQATTDRDAALQAKGAAQTAYGTANQNHQALAGYAQARDAAQAALDDATDVSRAEVLGVEDRTYDGTQQTQGGARLRITLTKGDRFETHDLPQGAPSELTISATYGENVHAGTGTVTLAAGGTRGSGTFWGSKQATFNIARRSLEGAAVSGVADVTYDGAAQAVRPTVTIGQASLVEGRDYEISYADNVNVGEATATFNGRGDYQGSKAISFRILPAQVTSVTVSPARLNYDGRAKTPALTVWAGGLVVPESGYEASYANNVEVGGATATVTGKGNFSGTASATFEIVVGVEPATTTLSGTDWSAVYDPATYAAENPDVADWARRADGSIDGDKLLSHFVNNGRKEGRASKEGFELASYYNANADLRRAFGTDWARYYDHYRSSGQRENRACSGVGALRGAVTSRDGVDWAPVYDAVYYARQNPDVARWATRSFSSGSVLDDAALLQHFVGSGAKECRSGKAGFDVRSYYNANPDLRAAFAGTADWTKYYRHYATNGSKEGRRCTGASELVGSVNVLSGTNWSAVYDRAYYGQRNADIASWATRKCGSATVVDDYAMLSHFVNNGRKEGRASKASFELASYYNANVDLRRAFGTDWARYYDHYRANGQREGRAATGVGQLRGAPTTLENVNWAPVYDANYYAERNADVANWARRGFASGSVLDDAALLSHFVNSGTKEARTSKQTFDVRAYKGKNADLARAFGSDWKPYYRHYALYGVGEHRACV